MLALGLSTAGCGSSEAGSPFVLPEGGADAEPREPDGGVTTMTVRDSGSPEAATYGEWGGPCLDDGQCSDGIDCTDDACDPSEGRCHFSPVDERCDDGTYCDGVERCVPGQGCRPGEAVACSDLTACTIDACDEKTHACTHSPRDADGDGDPDGNCPGGHDCNDADPAVSSTATEICGNGIDDNCDGRIDESTCKAPRYDGCAHPLVVDAPGTFSLSADAARLDYSATCVKANSRFSDLVASVVVPDGDPVDVDVVLSSPTAGVSLGLSAESRCGSADTELACATGVVAADGSAVARLVLHSAGPGKYPILLFTDSSGPLTLSVDYRPATDAPSNETCGTAERLSEGVHVHAVLAAAAADVKTECAGAAGDLVYDFVLDEPRDVHVYATAEDSFGTPIVSLRDAKCNEIGCREEPNDELFRRALPAGHYFVAISATGPSDVDVVYETAPPTVAPADETCAGAPPLVAGQTTVVDLAGHTDDLAPGCSVGYVDAAYSLSVDRTSDVLLVESLSDADSGAVALSTPACVDGAALACSSATASPARAPARGVAKGDYRVLVESELGAPTSVTAFVRPAADSVLVPFSDSCDESLTEIPPTGGLFRGNTANAGDDYSASCDFGGAAGGRDQMLHLRLAAASRVVLDAEGSGYSTIVDVRSGATCPGNEIPTGCSAGYVRGGSFLDLSLAPGDYWVQIDGYDGSSGAWVLDVYVAPESDKDGG